MIANALDIISDATLLTADDITKLTKIKGELTQTWETVQVFRTETEMKYSVLKHIKHPTPDSKYWQAVREQNGMFAELVHLSYRYRTNAIKIKKAQKKCTAESDELEKELIKIEIESKSYSALQMERTAHERIREIMLWSRLKNELKPLLKHGDKDVNKHQLDAMRIRFKREAALVTDSTAITEKINVLGKAESVENDYKP